jgi:biopolymer transport protein ExbD
LISADRRTPYQAVVTAMDSAARLGLTHLSLPTTQAEDAP